MSNVGNTPPDYTIPLGQVRALIGDFEAVPLSPPVPGQGEYMWFGDEALQGLLNIYGDDPRLTAAQAFRTIASSQALLLKKWSADDLSVDGAAISEALRKIASDLEEQVVRDGSMLDIFELAEIGGSVELTPEGTTPVIGTYWIYGRQTYSFSAAVPYWL